jgi:hypothetical protein
MGNPVYRVGTRLYMCWWNMHRRCSDRGRDGYKNYGGRGVRVCSRWKTLERFVADVGPHPGKGWTLDRRDNDGDYCPDNCRWATHKIQNRNSRNCKLSVRKVEKIRKKYRRIYGCLVDLGKKYGVHPSTISNIVLRKTWI